MKNLIRLTLIFFFISVFLSAETDNPFLSLNFNLGFSFIGQRGNNSEYISSVNPFPLTPSHSVTSVGGNINLRLRKKLILGLNMEYSMNKKLSLIDPSDQDELVVDSIDFYNFFIDLKYMFSLFNLNSFISFGAGNNITKGCDETWATTKKGYKIFLPEIDSRTSPIMVITAGIIFPLSDTLNIFTDASSYYLINEKISMFRISLGLSFTIIDDAREQK